MRPAVVVLLLLLSPFATPAAAQMDHGDHGAEGLMADLNEDVRSVRDKLLALAEATPADAYDWRPAEGVRSVREVFLHVASDNYLLPAAAGTEPPPATGIAGEDFRAMYAGVQAYEARMLSRDEVIRELRASFDHLQGAMVGEDDASLGRTLDLFGQPATHRKLWIVTTTHLHEHLGQMIAYARSNGIVPPWSR